MSNINITPIIEIIIALIATVFTVLVIPWIKTKISASQYEFLQKIAETAVNAAEAIFIGTKLGKDKLKYVTEYLEAFCEEKGWKYDEATLRQAIENAWKNMSGK